jgi:hypothetical protein
VPARRAERVSPAAAGLGEERRGRVAFQARRHHGFNDSLSKLKSDVRATIAARLQTFVKYWTDGTLDREPNILGLDFKSIHGPDPKRWKVQQIRANCGALAMRVALTVLHEQQEIWFLEIYKKGDQKAGIRRATNRVRELRE